MANDHNAVAAAGDQPECGTMPIGARDDASFGARLRQLRRTRGLSQTDLAARLNVSVPAISAWEKGRARPRHSRIAALGRILGVSDLDLLGQGHGAATPDPLAESRGQIARLVGTTPDKVRILIEY